METSAVAKKNRVLVDMSATLLHHGHVRLLQRAKELGYVVVALTTDEEIIRTKGYEPELSYDERKEILLALKYVDEVIPSPWLISESYMAEHQIDILLHGDDNANKVAQLKTYPRTEGISSSGLREKAARAIVQKKNSQKCLVTPGPTNIHSSSIIDIEPVFSRDDEEYKRIEHIVCERILALAGQDSLAILQGSATTAIEVATSNFLNGNVAVVTSGFYSERMFDMIKRKANAMGLTKVDAVDYAKFVENPGLTDGADWIVATSTETADAFLGDLKLLKQAANKGNSRLMIDATGSINLEDHHELADVTMFSSCKGLGGFTGAGFITYNKVLLHGLNPVQRPFALDLVTHIEKRVTCPAHAVCSLYSASERFAQARADVRAGKEKFMQRFSAFIARKGNQPALCTMFKAAKVEYPEGTVVYSPRRIQAGHHVICHLFEQFEANRTPGSFYENIKVS
ncbi:MAG TPA: adenylyltransferase/cytidyltransferase family protein [Planktothrix sp.]|jgi:2-aminoethylphosphonate-pyruvate transaminase